MGFIIYFFQVNVLHVQKYLFTFGDSESFFGEGPIPEEADGWSTSRMSWLEVSTFNGSWFLSSLLDLEKK